MWIKNNEELINLNKVTTIKKSTGENLFDIILMDSGRGVKKLTFSEAEDRDDYFEFLEVKLQGNFGEKVSEHKGKGTWKK